MTVPGGKAPPLICGTNTGKYCGNGDGIGAGIHGGIDDIVLIMVMSLW